MVPITLSQYLARMHQLHGVDSRLTQLVDRIAETCKAVGFKVRGGNLAGVLGSNGTENVQGETQKKLDVIANEIICNSCVTSGLVSAVASEEMVHPLQVPEDYPVAPYVALFDPLDGSSNIDVNITIGTIFSILPIKEASHHVADEEFLQPGRNQVAAGFVLYGPQTILVLTMGYGTSVFTLDPASFSFLCTTPNVQIDPDTQEFAINCAHMRFWARPVQRYIGEVLKGAKGPRGKDFNMRWIATFVAEVNRILVRGGIFTYPWDSRDPSRPGKLRLMYEANPCGMVVEQAGGLCVDGFQRILDIQPHAIHQRVPVFLGAKNEIELIVDYHKQALEEDRRNKIFKEKLSV